jgi:predicted GNAT family acetyltransferase
MNETPAKIQVIDNADQCRYEVSIGDRLAGFAKYRRRGDRVVFIHTEIGKEFAGKGLGGVLARHAVEDANAQGLTIVPVCPFIAAWLRNHPEARKRVDWEAARALTAGMRTGTVNASADGSERE